MQVYDKDSLKIWIFGARLARERLFEAISYAFIKSVSNMIRKLLRVIHEVCVRILDLTYNEKLGLRIRV